MLQFGREQYEEGSAVYCINKLAKRERGEGEERRRGTYWSTQGGEARRGHNSATTSDSPQKSKCYGAAFDKFIYLTIYIINK